MTIKNIVTQVTGLSDVNPTFIYVDTNDSVATVTTAGYLNSAALSGYPISDKNMAVVTTKTTPSALVSSTNIYTISVSNGIITLSAIGGGGVTFPITVAEGGTGETSLTPYSVMAGGTSGTGNVQQVASLGTSGQVLTSAGAGALPTWTNASGTGTVNSGTINQLAWYAGTGATLSGLAIVNSAGLLTSSGGVPGWVAYTGTGAPVLATSPTLITPTLGVAAATSINFGQGPLANHVPTASFTPAITFVTPGDLTVSYSTQIGFHTRTGDIVVASVALTFTPTYTTSNGGLMVTGLPITSASTGATCAVDLEHVPFPSGCTSPFAQIGNGDNVVLIFASGTGIASGEFDTTQFVSGTAYSILFTLTYFAS